MLSTTETRAGEKLEVARGELDIAWEKVGDCMLEGFTSKSWEGLEAGLEAESRRIAAVLARKAKEVTLDLINVVGRWPESTEALLENPYWTEAGYPLGIEIIQVGLG